jgi:hypothetical protein
MALSNPKVLVFSHSFAKGMHRDLRSNFDVRAALNFNMHNVATKLHGVAKLIKFYFDRVNQFQLYIAILEFETNDLAM